MINEVDLKSLWSDLDSFSNALDKEKAALGEVWIKIAEIKTQNEKEIQDLDTKIEFQFLDLDSIISINVGGQIFEASVEILTRDPYSVLAGLCRESPIVEPDEDGIFYIDRDWWLFRHILAFLKSNILPNELETLKELYMESSFYRLESLQKAIENIPVDQVANLTPQIAVTWSGVRENNINSRSQYSTNGMSTRHSYEDSNYRSPSPYDENGSGYSSPLSKNPSSSNIYSTALFRGKYEYCNLLFKLSL